MALTSARQILNKKILGGGSSEDVQELKVEVAALSASVLTIGEKVENATEYSTTEHIVGKWIDGSDIYEQTYDFGANGVKISQGSTAPTTISSAGIDILISSEGISPTYKCWPIIGAEKGDYIDAVNHGLGEKNVRYFTFRYTKTAPATSKKSTRKSTK